MRRDKSLHGAPSPPTIHRERWFLLLVAGLTCGLRLPFRSHFLSNHDAVNYALALERFDMRVSQPHPPGYILYILWGRLLNALLNDPTRSLIGLSILGSSLAVVALYLITREMYDRRTGAIAVLLLCFNPTFWLFGEVALPYTLDLFASALLAWLCWRTEKRRTMKQLALTAFSLGLVGAFRPQTMVFLTPLFLYAARFYPGKQLIPATFIVALPFVSFFVPSVLVSGGPANVLRLMRRTVPVFYSQETMRKSVRVPRYIRNADTTFRYVFRTLGELGAPLVVIGVLAEKRLLQFWRNSRLRFMVIWILPTFIFYLLIWPGNLGTILVCIPPFFLLAAAGLNRVLRSERGGRPLGGLILLTILLWSTASFITLPRYPLGERYREFDNYQRLVAIDAYYDAKLALLQEIPPEGTIVFANDFRHLQYYLPTYRTYSYPTLYRSDPSLVKLVISVENGQIEPWSGIHTQTLIPETTRRVVLFDLPRELANVEPAALAARSRAGQSIFIITVDEGATALWTETGLSLTRETVKQHED